MKIVFLGNTRKYTTTDAKTGKQLELDQGKIAIGQNCQKYELTMELSAIDALGYVLEPSEFNTLNTHLKK